MSKYIIIGNNQEWCFYSWEKAIVSDSVIFYNSISDLFNGSLLGILCRKHFGVRENDGKQKPFRSIWYRLLIKKLHLSNNDKCYIVFYDRGLLSRDLSFIDYIKRECPKTSVVYLFSNIARISGAIKYGIINNINNHYDQVFAFDPQDALVYGFELSPLIYSCVPGYKEMEKHYDVFYVGNAKDRLDTLHEIYQKCFDSGFKCCFFINGVPPEKQIYKGIHYNTYLPYKEVLNYIAQSRCLVDAIQGGSSAMTIKVCESVAYDKKLITTNECIKHEFFYSPRRIMVYKSQENISHFLTGEEIRYSENEKNYFSHITFFEKLK